MYQLGRRKFILGTAAVYGIGTSPLGDSALPLVDTRVYALRTSALRFHTVLRHGARLWSFGGERAQDPNIEERYMRNLYRIDLMMDRSIDRHDLPIGIAHAATVKHGHYAVTFGGMSSNNGQFVSSSRIVLTDLETGHSTFAGKLPLGIHDPAAVAVSASRSIVFGGWYNAVSAAQASIIDLNNKSELSVTPFTLVESRSYATGHSTEDGKVIVVGGLHRPRESQVLNLSSVERIDISRKSSESWTYMHQPRRYHSSRKIGNYIYVLGGTGVNKMGRPPALSSIERIDLNSGEVKVVGSLLQPRYHCQSFALDYNGRSYVCVFGGQSDSETAVRTLEVFDCWSAKSHLLSTLPIEIIDHDKITVCLGNKVYVVGGESLSTDMGQNSLLEIEFQGSSRCYRA